MTKITYLLGAGASAGALPVINNMADRIDRVIAILEQSSLLEERQRRMPRHTSFIDRLTHLKGVAEKHSSVDTYAKKLYLAGNTKDLNLFKLTLSCYLILEHLINGYDKRYDSFLVSILNSKVDDFVDNVRIASWNYDYQVEYAYSTICGNSSIESLRKRLSYNDYSKSDRFKFIKLNGSINSLDDDDDIGRFDIVDEAGLLLCNNNSEDILYKQATRNNDSVYLPSIDNMDVYEQFIDNVSDAYNKVGMTKSPLKFAWESMSGMNANETISKYCNALADTHILVVIGYSFPFFNRAIDRALIGPANMPSLGKIYIQDKYPDKIKLRMKSIRDLEFDNSEIDVELIDETDQFFIPYEM